MTPTASKTRSNQLEGVDFFAPPAKTSLIITAKAVYFHGSGRKVLGWRIPASRPFEAGTSDPQHSYFGCTCRPDSIETENFGYFAPSILSRTPKAKRSTNGPDARRQGDMTIYGKIGLAAARRARRAPRYVANHHITSYRCKGFKVGTLNRCASQNLGPDR